MSNSDDYGQFVALDIDYELEPIESFKIKSTTLKDNNKDNIKYNIKDKTTIIENKMYWCILGLCIIIMC